MTATSFPFDLAAPFTSAKGNLPAVPSDRIAGRRFMARGLRNRELERSAFAPVLSLAIRSPSLIMNETRFAGM